MTRWRCRVYILVWKSRDLFRVISKRNRLISDFKAVFDQKFIYLSHVTSWWCPDLSPSDTLVIFNKLFFSLQERDFGSKKEILFTPYQFRIFLVASPILGYASTINDGLWRSLVLFKWCLGKVFYCWVGSRDLFRFISMFFRVFSIRYHFSAENSASPSDVTS